MTNNEFSVLCMECETMIRMAAPYKTGNLRYNAIKVEFPDADTCEIYVDEKIAPYMKYTNEPWKRGKNPNEGWFDRVAKRVIEYAAMRLRGEIKED